MTYRFMSRESSDASKRRQNEEPYNKTYPEVSLVEETNQQVQHWKRTGRLSYKFLRALKRGDHGQDTLWISNLKHNFCLQ